MTEADRIKILELARPAATMPDMEKWLARASELEAWVSRSGHSSDPQKATLKAPEARTPLPSQSPARR